MLPLLFISGFILELVIVQLSIMLKKNKRIYYEKDVVDGVIWEWSNLECMPKEQSLLALCPKCEAELKLFDSYILCQLCGFKKEVPTSKFRDLIIVEIEKRERNGEFKNCRKRLKELKKSVNQ
jgi:hypothetical protein